MDVLAANLSALARVDPVLAERLRAVEPAALQWQPSKAGPLSASVTAPDGRSLALASRYEPVAEAKKLLAGVAYEQTACVALLGFGLGYHAAEAAPRLGFGGLLVIYEPDEALLRAALERIDHTGWIGQGHQVFLTGEPDRAALLARVERHAGLVTQGTRLVTHPPTRQLHPDRVARFGNDLTETLAYCRTTVATALVNSTRTAFNSASNLDRYAAGPTTDELFDAARGYPAVCVGAGPSLVKNVDLLRDPAVRRNVVVIAAQTTLQPLLDRGIRPDFVTALDYSDISRRFYEGVTAADVADTTLVAEPKAHPAILDAFPGAIRTTTSGFNDLLLGDLGGRHTRPIPGGATVAHLSFYLAQYLGCGPIILIGQDLGFSDGLYYAPGTAIHRVWACELGPFNTVEMMEWQRVARHKNHLQKLTDIHGRPCYSDEQMITYLKQFERDFAAAEAAGGVVIDATEGGLPKRHTTRMTLRDALAAHATRPVPPLPRAGCGLDASRLARTAELLTKRVRETEILKRTCRDAADLLTRMSEHRRDRARMRELFAKLDQHTRRVNGELKTAFDLVSGLNVIGTFKRVKNDRVIANAAAGTTPEDRQAEQIDRDLENMKWLEEACEETLRVLHSARQRVKARLVASPESGVLSPASGAGVTSADSGLAMQEATR